MATQFTDNNFETEVLQSTGVVVVDFWAQWCGPCRALGPVIEELSKEYAGKAVIGKCDVDANSKTSSQFGITSIPAIVFFKDGKEVDRVIGAQSKSALAKKIDGLI